MTEANDTEADGGSSPGYVDTPHGILSAGGRWYHISESGIRDYAGEVLEHVSLEQLLEWADTWTGSARTAVLWLLPVLLWMLPVDWAVGGAVVLYAAWALASPALPSLLAVRAVSALDQVLLQGVYYVITMSVLAAAGLYDAVVVGLTGFILLRWGILGWAFGYLVRPLRRQLYPLPVADQVLRGLIIRLALKHRLSVPQVNEITRDIIENWGDHSGSDNS